jgi:hypothetical protein
MPITSEHFSEEVSKLELLSKNLTDPYEIIMVKSQIFIMRLLKDIRNNIYLLSETKKQIRRPIPHGDKQIRESNPSEKPEAVNK